MAAQDAHVKIASDARETYGTATNTGQSAGDRQNGFSRPYRVRKQRGEGYVDRETKARRQAWKAVREFGRGERVAL